MDYLKDCMNDVGNPPLDAMQRNFCLVCANRQCDRAGMNQSSFDGRVKNWKSLLFDNVPRAEPGDERYSNITSKNFSPAGKPRPPSTTVFVPGVPVVTRPAPPAEQQPAAFVQAEPPIPPLPQEAMAQPPQEEAARPPLPHVVDPGSPDSPIGSPGNTAFEQGMVLDGAPAPKAAPEESRPQGKTFILDDD